MESKKTFDDLNLKKDLLEGIYLYGFKKPSDIQIKGIEAICTGKDCILQSQSGTGKTATYLLGILNRLEVNNKLQGIVIAPTRELADQVFNVAKELTKKSKLSVVKCTGGTNIYKNKKEIKNKNLIVGTIGRINHMIEDKIIQLLSLFLTPQSAISPKCPT